MAVTKGRPNHNRWENCDQHSRRAKTQTYSTVFPSSAYSSCVKTNHCSFPLLYGHPKIHLTTFYTLFNSKKCQMENFLKFKLWTWCIKCKQIIYTGSVSSDGSAKSFMPTNYLVKLGKSGKRESLVIKSWFFFFFRKAYKFENMSSPGSTYNSNLRGCKRAALLMIHQQANPTSRRRHGSLGCSVLRGCIVPTTTS